MVGDAYSASPEALITFLNCPNTVLGVILIKLDFVAPKSILMLTNNDIFLLKGKEPVIKSRLPGVRVNGSEDAPSWAMTSNLRAEEFS